MSFLRFSIQSIRIKLINNNQNILLYFNKCEIIYLYPLLTSIVYGSFCYVNKTDQTEKNKQNILGN